MFGCLLEESKLAIPSRSWGKVEEVRRAACRIPGCISKFATTYACICTTWLPYLQGVSCYLLKICGGLQRAPFRRLSPNVVSDCRNPKIGLGRDGHGPDFEGSLNNFTMRNVNSSVLNHQTFNLNLQKPVDKL